MSFLSKDEAILWILTNQLGRRNLTDFQRNKVALKYEEVIAEQMKQRMSDGGGDKKSEKAKIGYDQMNHPDLKPTTKRKELAKIAGTSEADLQNLKSILTSLIISIDNAVGVSTEKYISPLKLHK